MDTGRVAEIVDPHAHLYILRSFVDLDLDLLSFVVFEYRRADILGVGRRRGTRASEDGFIERHRTSYTAD